MKGWWYKGIKSGTDGYFSGQVHNVLILQFGG